jgi:hypothetical protein
MLDDFGEAFDTTLAQNFGIILHHGKALIAA